MLARPEAFVHRAIMFIMFVAGCAAAPEEAPVNVDALRAEAVATLDDFHAAASAADGARYFAHFASDGVFLGTDASERWTVEQFRAYATPHFDAGEGWTYVATERHVDVDREYAWFDELLDNAKYGVARGTGVLRREGGAWKVVQYHLTFPIPNDLADDLTRRIRERGAR
jgi:hypothetical protein